MKRLTELTFWGAAFQLLSLPRCNQLFSEIGLAQAIVLNPRPLNLAAQNYITKMYELYDSPSNNFEQTFAAQEQLVKQTFEKVTEDYGKSTALHLEKWCILHCVDYTTANAIDDIKNTLTQLCKLTTYSHLKNTPLLSTSGYAQICQITVLYLLPAQLEEINSRIELLKEQPLTEWESWVDERIHYHDGYRDYTMGLLDLALTRLETTVVNTRVIQTLKIIYNSITSQDFDSLTEFLSQTNGWNKPDNLQIDFVKILTSLDS